MILAAILLTISWASLRRHPVLGFGPSALTRIACRDDGSWWGQLSNGAEGLMEIRPGTRILAGQVLLQFNGPADSRRTTRLLLGDEILAEPFRRLRQLLLTTNG